MKLVHLNYAEDAIPTWSGFLSAELKSQVNSFLKRAFKLCQVSGST